MHKLETTVTRDAKIKENMQCISIGWMDKIEDYTMFALCMGIVLIIQKELVGIYYIFGVGINLFAHSFFRY